MAGRPRQVNKDDVESQQALAEQAASELPPEGHERREALKRRMETLEEQIARMSDKILQGTIDAKELEIVDEIASKTQYLSVSNADPEYVYGWKSTNRHSQHVQACKALGWEIVQGDDPEAIELKNVHDNSTARTLGDVVLMRIKRDRYIVLRAQEQAKTRRIQGEQGITPDLLQMMDKYKDRGITLTPYRMRNLAGPDSWGQNVSRQAIMDAIREGTIPGMEINQ